MTKSLLAATAILAGLAGAALASYAPIKYTRSRADIAASCAAMGANGVGYGLERASGPYGCRNMENGNAVKCTADNRCTDYSGDYRWKKIKTLLNGESTGSNK